jgi:hypothetical protein
MREWGAAEVGEDNRLSPAELAELFGWTAGANTLSHASPGPTSVRPAPARHQPGGLQVPLRQRLRSLAWRLTRSNRVA